MKKRKREKKEEEEIGKGGTARSGRTYERWRGKSPRVVSADSEIKASLLYFSLSRRLILPTNRQSAMILRWSLISGELRLIFLGRQKRARASNDGIEFCQRRVARKRRWHGGLFWGAAGEGRSGLVGIHGAEGRGERGRNHDGKGERVVGYRATQTKNEGRKGSSHAAARACQLRAPLKGNAHDSKDKESCARRAGTRSRILERVIIGECNVRSWRSVKKTCSHVGEETWRIPKCAFR
jgi:hypothetical protein